MNLPRPSVILPSIMFPSLLLFLLSSTAKQGLLEALRLFVVFYCQNRALIALATLARLSFASDCRSLTATWGSEV